MYYLLWIIKLGTWPVLNTRTCGKTPKGIPSQRRRPRCWLWNRIPPFPFPNLVFKNALRVFHRDKNLIRFTPWCLVFFKSNIRPVFSLVRVRLLSVFGPDCFSLVWCLRKNSSNRNIAGLFQVKNTLMVFVMQGGPIQQ